MKSFHKSSPAFYKTSKGASKLRSSSISGFDTEPVRTQSKLEYGKELEQKIRKLVSENENLNILIRQLSQELERERSIQHPASFDGESDSKIEVLVKENDRLNELLASSTANIQSLQQQNSSLTKLMAQNAPKDFMGKLKYLQEENFRLNSTLIDRLKEIEQLKAQNEEPNLQIYQQIEELSSKIAALEYENNILKSNKGAHSRTNFRTSSPDREVAKLQEKIALLVAENERINRSLLEKSKEVEKARTTLGRGHKDTYAGEEKRASLLNEENKRLKAQIQELQSRSEELSDYKSKIGVIVEENDRLNQLLNDFTRESKDLKSEVSELEQQLVYTRKENMRLNELLEDAADNLERSKNAMNTIDRFQQENKLLKDESQRLEKLLRQKTEECEEMRLSCIDLSHKREENERRIHNLMRDNEDKTKRVAELEGRLDSLQKQFLQENANIGESLVEKDLQLNKALTRCSELELQIAKLLEEQDQINQLIHASSHLFKGSIPEISFGTPSKFNKGDPNQNSTHLLNLRRRTNGLRESVELVLDEFERLTRDNVNNMKEIDRNERDKDIILSLTEKIDHLQQENENLNKKIIEKQREQEKDAHVVINELQEKASKVLHLENEISSVYAANDDLAQRLHDLQSQLDDALHKRDEAERLKQSADRELILQKNRADSLEAAVEAKRKESNLLSQKVKDLEKNNELKEKIIANYQDELDKQQKELEKQISSLQKDGDEHANLTQRIHQLEDELIRIEEENVSLNQLVERKSQDLKEVCDKLALLEETSRYYDQIQRENSKLRAEAEKLNTLAENREIEIDKLKNNLELIPQLQNRIHFLSSENAAMNKEISELRQDGERCKDLEDFVKALQSKIRLLTDENSELEKRLSEAAERESSEFKARLSNPIFKKRTRSLANLGVRNSEIFSDYINETKELPSAERTHFENVNIKQQETGPKDQQIIELNRTVEELKKKNLQLELIVEQLPSLDNTIRSLNEEKQQLEEMLKEKERELIKIRHLLKDIDAAIKRGDDLKSKLNEIERECREETSDSLLFSSSRVRLEKIQKSMMNEMDSSQQLPKEDQMQGIALRGSPVEELDDGTDQKVPHS